MDTPSSLPTPRRQFVTVKQFVQMFPCYTEAGVRWLIFQSNADARSGKVDPNLADVFLRVGRKILIDYDLFVRWIELKNQR